MQSWNKWFRLSWTILSTWQHNCKSSTLGTSCSCCFYFVPFVLCGLSVLLFFLSSLSPQEPIFSGSLIFSSSRDISLWASALMKPTWSGCIAHVMLQKTESPPRKKTKQQAYDQLKQSKRGLHQWMWHHVWCFQPLVRATMAATLRLSLGSSRRFLHVKKKNKKPLSALKYDLCLTARTL